MPQWTWEYIDKHMTIPRLKTYYEVWRNSTPPLALAVSQALGFKRNKKRSVKEQFHELLGLGMKVGKEALPPSKQLKLPLGAKA